MNCSLISMSFEGAFNLVSLVAVSNDRVLFLDTAGIVFFGEDPGGRDSETRGTFILS